MWKTRDMTWSSSFLSPSPSPHPTMATDPAQELAQRQFNELSFFILAGLPQGSEFGLDSLVWTVSKFGVRSSSSHARCCMLMPC